MKKDEQQQRVSELWELRDLSIYNNRAPANKKKRQNLLNNLTGSYFPVKPRSSVLAESISLPGLCYLYWAASRRAAGFSSPPFFFVVLRFYWRFLAMTIQRIVRWNKRRSRAMIQRYPAGIFRIDETETTRGFISSNWVVKELYLTIAVMTVVRVPLSTTPSFDQHPFFV